MVNLQKYAHTYDRPILKKVPMYTRQCVPMYTRQIGLPKKFPALIYVRLSNTVSSHIWCFSVAFFVAICSRLRQIPISG